MLSLSALQFQNGSSKTELKTSYLWNVPVSYLLAVPVKYPWSVVNLNIYLLCSGACVVDCTCVMVDWPNSQTCECEWARTSEFYLSTSTCLWTWIYTCCALVRALWTVPVLWLTGQAVRPVNWTCECDWARTSEFYLTTSTCLWTEYIPVVWVPPVSCLWSLAVLT